MSSPRKSPSRKSRKCSRGVLSVAYRKSLKSPSGGKSHRKCKSKPGRKRSKRCSRGVVKSGKRAGSCKKKPGRRRSRKAAVAA